MLVVTHHAPLSTPVSTRVEIVRYCLARMDTKLRFKIVWDREAAKLLKTSAAQLHSIMIEVNSLLSQRFDDFRCVLLWACFCRFRVALVAFDNSNNRTYYFKIDMLLELQLHELVGNSHVCVEDYKLTANIAVRIRSNVVMSLVEADGVSNLELSLCDTSTIDLCKLLKDNLQMDEVKMRILFDKETCMSHIWLMVF
ncbi:hypothetical protein RYX36_018151, partial [Vicia faba]